MKGFTVPESCVAWVKPDFSYETFDCHLEFNHEGMHKGVSLGEVMVEGESKWVRLYVEWEDPKLK